VVAFTDHDALPDGAGLQVLRRLRSHPVKYILGVELTVSHVRELTASIPLFHLVGLFVDPREKSLRAYCRQRQAGRLARAKKMVTNLQRRGFALSWSDVVAVKKGLSVGRPHLVAALLQRVANRTRVRYLIKELGRQKAAEDRRYRALLALPRLAFQLYPLFLSKAALLPGVYVPYEENLDMDTAVRLLRGAGGLSFLAHWSFSRPVLTKKLLEKIVRQKRLDGLEVVYGLNVRERLGQMRQDFTYLKALAKRAHLLVSGGGDIHQAEDLRLFTRNPLSRQTAGLAERMIEKAQPNLTWTSFEK
jgi:predicted metal-dependent phosphoesterase TrpH